MRSSIVRLLCYWHWLGLADSDSETETDPRFLNMLSALEALITLGKCRELPVVGFVNDLLIMGIIVSE